MSSASPLCSGASCNGWWEKEFKNFPSLFLWRAVASCVGYFFPLKIKDLFNSPFGELHAHRASMLVQGSEAGTLVLLGGSLLAASLILRWGLPAVVRAFSRNPKVNLRAQETPSK